MPDIGQWVSLAERSLQRLRTDRTVLSFAVTHAGNEPVLAITVPLVTDPTSPGFDAWRLQEVQKQIRAALPQSIPFQIVGSQSRG